jgi:hypothetical protein
MDLTKQKYSPISIRFEVGFVCVYVGVFQDLPQLYLNETGSEFYFSQYVILKGTRLMSNRHCLQPELLSITHMNICEKSYQNIFSFWANLRIQCSRKKISSCSESKFEEPPLPIFSLFPIKEGFNNS